MARWNNKEEFLKWITREYNKYKTFHYYLSINNEKYPKKYNKDCTCELSMSCSNSSISLIEIKKLLNNKILEHLNAYLYDRDIEISHIYLFFRTIESVNFFELSKFSRDIHEYKREVNQLKKTADRLQKFSKEQIIIKIPILPFITIYQMIVTFKRYGLTKNEIEIFTSYFGLNSRYRKTKSYTLFKEELSKKEIEILEFKIKELKENSKKREKKYNGFSWRTEKEYNQMIEEHTKISQKYHQMLNDRFYYKAFSSIS